MQVQLGDNAGGQLTLRAPEGWSLAAGQKGVTLDRKGDAYILTLPPGTTTARLVKR
jgi:hypothetical protein